MLFNNFIASEVINKALFYVFDKLVILEIILESLLVIVPILLTVAFFTLFERKLMSSVQRRRGPNVVGFWGLLQPIADGLKLIVKEFIIPRRSVSAVFIFSPIWTFTASFTAWSIIPFNFSENFSDLTYGILALLALSGLGVFGIILSGWSSNTHYALLGSLRSAAQLISYEISFSLTILPVIVWSNSFNLINIINSQVDYYGLWYCIPFLPFAFIFFVSILAETNRTPFDLPEAEAELVAGFNVEYSSTPFALFFLAEYSSILVMSCLFAILFFGGWGMPFFFKSSFWLIIKTLVVCFFFVLVRAALPRYRYDQLMSLCWQIFLPISFGFFHFFFGIKVLADTFFYLNFK